MNRIPPNEADERLHRDIMELIARHLTPNTAERVLAIASIIVGQVLAMQNQRTMTAERGMAIIQANIEEGNRQVISRLLNKTAGRA